MSSDMRFVNDYRNVTSSFTSSLSLYTPSMNYRFLDDTTSLCQNCSAIKNQIKMRKVSIRQSSGLVKRETGASPVRTRHRNLQALIIYHWETGKENQSVRAISRETCLSQYRNGKFMPRVTGSTKERNFRLLLLTTEGQFLFCTPSFEIRGIFFDSGNYDKKSGGTK